MVNKFAVTGSAKNFDVEVDYPEISKCLKSLGMIETNMEDCEGLVFINFNKKAYKKYKKLGKNLNNLVLIRLEPFAVFPRQYQKYIEKKFKLIISPGSKLSNFQNDFDFIGWPYKYNLNPASPKYNTPQLNSVINKAVEEKFFDFNFWNEKYNKIVLISANKVSPTSKSNYKIRREIAKKMKLNEIDIYGDLWESNIAKKFYHRLAVCLYSLKLGYFPNLIEIYGSMFTTFQNIKGVIPDKHSVIQKYKYSLVIENSSDYCSEKLLDAIINGSIPIYIGPRNDQIRLPENLYFLCNGSIEEIRKFIDTITPRQASDMLKSMEVYIQSNEFKLNWESEEVYSKISNIVYEFWNSK